MNVRHTIQRNTTALKFSNLVSVNSVTLFSCTAVALFYLFKQYSHTPLVPFGDDLPTIFHYLFRYDQALSLSEKLAIIFNNRMVEHRLLSSSLITLLSYLFLGKIQLPILTSIAGCMWVSISLFYYKWLKNINLSVAWLFPIACILFSSASYQVILWPMAALQHLTIVFLGFSTIQILSIKKFSTNNIQTILFFILAITTAVIATFSAGNGMLIWPTGFLLLALKKEIKPLIIWSICSIFSVTGNFWNSSLNGTPSENSIKTLCTNLFKEVISFFAGLGGAIHVHGHEPFLDDCDLQFSLKYPSIYLGLFIFAVFIYLLSQAIKNQNKKFLPILGSSIFIFLTVGILVIGRTPANGDMVVFKSRYYLYSIIAISNTVFLIAAISQTTMWHRWILIVTTVLSISFWGVWEVLSSHKIINHFNELQVGQFNWEKNNQWVIYQPTAYFENYFISFFNEIKNKPLGYQLPSTTINTAFKQKIWANKYFSPLKKLQIQEENGNKRLVRLYIINDQAEPVQRKNEGYAVLMASKKDTFLLWSVVSPTGVRNFLKTGQTCLKGYRVEVGLDREKIPKGIYSLHQFYYSRENAIANKKTDGEITF